MATDVVKFTRRAPTPCRDADAAIATKGVDELALLANINPNFTWVRLAQRVPVRIALGPIPPGVRFVQASP